VLTLYHFGGAICAQKVRIALFEKQLEWESVDCSGAALRAENYLSLNPNGVVPTLIHDGAILTESRIISEYINDAFVGPALMPAGSIQRHRARLWSKQIDDVFHLNIFILTFVAIAREDYLQLAPEVRSNAMPGLCDPIKRTIANELPEGGMQSPWIGIAIKRFCLMLEAMEQQLEQSPFLAGDTYTLADADYTAYLKRLADLGFGALWENKSSLCGWWGRMSAGASFETAILAWKTPEVSSRYERARSMPSPSGR